MYMYVYVIIVMIVTAEAIIIACKKLLLSCIPIWNVFFTAHTTYMYICSAPHTNRFQAWSAGCYCGHITNQTCESSNSTPQGRTTKCRPPTSNSTPRQTTKCRPPTSNSTPRQTTKVWIVSWLPLERREVWLSPMWSLQVSNILSLHVYWQYCKLW